MGRHIRSKDDPGQAAKSEQGDRAWSVRDTRGRISQFLSDEFDTVQPLRNRRRDQAEGYLAGRDVFQNLYQDVLSAFQMVLHQRGPSEPSEMEDLFARFEAQIAEELAEKGVTVRRTRLMMDLPTTPHGDLDVVALARERISPRSARPRKLYRGRPPRLRKGESGEQQNTG